MPTAIKDRFLRACERARSLNASRGPRAHRSLEFSLDMGDATAAEWVPLTRCDERQTRLESLALVLFDLDDPECEAAQAVAATIDWRS